MLTNTMGRKKEEFKPLEAGRVRIYTCGPTVYDYAHIGNFRTYVFEDVLRRTLEFLGYEVVHVMNITDVGHLTSDADTGEDKIALAAKERRKTAWEVAEYFTKAFLEDAERLNILKPHIMPRATEHIGEMIDLIRRLEEKGYTYAIDDGVYFDTSKLPDYGKLTGMSFEGLQKSLMAGARVEFNPQKRNVTDFALWKLTPKGVRRDMEWDSPWGRGFPGWHVECSAMSMKYLGETIDIHAGGVDHIPIHHTNEIAQSEAATGKPFVRYWFHCDFLLMGERRIGKSEGNIVTLRDVMARGYTPRALRFFYLTSHYRAQQTFTWQALEAAQKGVNRLFDFVQRLKEAEGVHEEAVGRMVEELERRFVEAVSDDLDTPRALAALFDFASKVGALMEAGRISHQDGQAIIKALIRLDWVLGLGLEEALEEPRIPQEVKRIVEEREEARRAGNYALSDSLRERVKEHGFMVEDTAKGPRVKRLNW